MVSFLHMDPFLYEDPFFTQRDFVGALSGFCQGRGSFFSILGKMVLMLGVLR